MAWDHLSVTKPHLVYIILGGFTTLFMLCSSIIKEKLYIGEATVATIVGVIFGPYAANLINPRSWGNVDLITLEFSRIVLVVQCFAVGVELPKAYMERHWRSVILLLVPVMTFGWLITSLFIWGMFYQYVNWLDSLCIAACVTATDPVLASSVVGKGKFAKRVPKHLRDLLSAESGSNDGMAFPFVYLALYIIQYRGHTAEIAKNWILITILYECIFGAFYGFTIGYLARRAIRHAHEREWIDRESFLVFYFVLALFCAGSGSLLGMDDLLIGFACGVGFSNDGWFTEKTEESHVSNVIDLLLNLTFFVYFGSILPWDEYNSGLYGLKAWRLVAIAILVLFFRRIPIMVLLKPFIADIKNYHESFFAGHFGPIGVGAIFVSLLARAELETESVVPTKNLPPADFPHQNIIVLIWPITTFMIIASILVHGSSIAVFTLGKHINTLTITLSYTQDNKDGPSWMDRLPRIQSRSRSQPPARYDSDYDEKSFPPGTLPRQAPFLRRQREHDSSTRARSGSPYHRTRSAPSWDTGRGYGGPISSSAITPLPRAQSNSPREPLSRSDSETLAVKRNSSSASEDRRHGSVTSPIEVFEEGQHTIYEDRDGDVLAVEEATEDGLTRKASEVAEGRRLARNQETDSDDSRRASQVQGPQDIGEQMLDKVKSVEEMTRRKFEQPSDERPVAGGGVRWRQTLARISSRTGEGWGGHVEKEAVPQQAQRKGGPARAYQYGNTIIIEDEDGEVIKKYDIPAPDKPPSTSGEQNVARHRIIQMGKYLGLRGKRSNEEVQATASTSGAKVQPSQTTAETNSKPPAGEEDDDQKVRFTVNGSSRRMSKADFIDVIQQMDTKRRVQTVESSNVSEAVKQEARAEAREQAALKRRTTSGKVPTMQSMPITEDAAEPNEKDLHIQRTHSRGSADLKLIDSNTEVPFHNVSADLRRHQLRSTAGETPADRRRRSLVPRQPAQDDSEDDGTERVPRTRPANYTREEDLDSHDVTSETPAERRRRLAALGLQRTEDSDSDSEGQRPKESRPRQSIRFAGPLSTPASSTGTTPRQSTLRWSKGV